MYIFTCTIIIAFSHLMLENNVADNIKCTFGILSFLQLLIQLEFGLGG